VGGSSIAGIRAFVAILLTDDVRSALDAHVDRLRPVGGDVSWIARDNLHVTLKFLGQVEPERLDHAVSALALVATAVARFELAVVGLGAFPSPTRPRVVWAGLQHGADAAAVLARAIDGALAEHGFAREERPFAGHVTLGRVRQPGRDRGLAALLAAGAGHRFGRLTVDRFALMRSDLSPRGARYSIIDAWPLSASPGPGAATVAR
jgi:RNA 2',3'-cyclic 3'-phosphodiesterase